MKITFHQFTMGDVDDLDVYVAQPIWEWQQTDQGQWVMEHAQDLRYHTSANPATFGYRIRISGDLDDKQATEYFLRWNPIESS